MKKLKTTVNSRSLCWKIACMSCIKFKFKNWRLMQTMKIQYLIYLQGISHKNWYILKGHIPIVVTNKPTFLYRNNNIYSSKWNPQNIWWLIYQVFPCSLVQCIMMQSNWAHHVFCYICHMFRSTTIISNSYSQLYVEFSILAIV